MDIEFHYYMTYLIAARAGFPPNEALIIARSAQGVDDNHVLVEVGRGTPTYYRNVISQTMDITHPQHADKIYPIFHFIPGDPNAPTARRKDGRIDKWVTTPDSPLALAMLDSALASRDLYRIGASAHAYVDTWAHQNFVGKRDDFNIVPPQPGDEGEPISQAFLDSVAKVGHAPVKHNPDLPGLIWIDRRLVDEHETVNNKTRFLDAAGRLFQKLTRHLNPNVNPTEMLRQEGELRADLDVDIGQRDPNNALRNQRIARYQARARTPQYGGTALPLYVEHDWAIAAFTENHLDLVAQWKEKAQAALGDYGDLIAWGERVHVTWKDPGKHRQTDWYSFQEAIRTHLDECWTILVRQIPDVASG